MAHLVKRPTLDFGSGHDLMVHQFKPYIGLCTDSMEPAWDSLPPSLSAPPPLVHVHRCTCALSLSLSFKINKLKKMNGGGTWVPQSFKRLTSA